MTCGTIKNSKDIFRKTVKSLFFCYVYSFLLLIVFSTHSYALIGTSCDALPDGTGGTVAVTPDAGANCDYLGLPICTTTSTSTVIPPASPEPRVNCADLIDMPLCSDIDGVIEEGRNCVPECALIGDSVGVRGEHFAVHNKHCIRFCGPTLSDGTTNNETLAATLTDPVNGKCVTRKCHQDVNGYTGGSSCDLLSCKLLTIDELNHPAELTNPKFSDSSKQFCDGSEKCYAFAQGQLQYLISRQTNTMCTMHECQPDPQPASDACYDDTKNIIEHVGGNAYVTAYEQHIVGIDPTTPTDPNDPRVPEPLATLNPSDNNAAVREQLARTCSPITVSTSQSSCLPLVKRRYYCDFDAAISSTVRTRFNALCDDDEVINPSDSVTFSPHITRCDQGFCYKTIDCNKPENASELECGVPSSGEEGSSDSSNEEDSDSWFYRPKPLNKATQGNGTLRSSMDQNDLHYSTDDLDGNSGWGWHPKIRIPYIGTIDLGFFHSQYNPDETRSPGHRSASKDGFRGTGYLYLCGNEGNINAMVSDHTLYHKGKVETTFTNTDAITSMEVCLRFKNAVRPSDINGSSETCGKRECAISCAFGLCASQLCGFDVCKTVSVQETQATKCQMDNDFFNNTNDTNCSTIVDDYLRVRVVQFENKVCTFLDSKGQFAYNKMFMNGKERLSDGTCLVGADSDGNCNGFDSNGAEGVATKWRAVKHIPFTQSDSKSGQNGFWMANGSGGWTLVPAQECAKLPLRARPPKLYNLATKENSFKIFSPPLYISETYIEKDGVSSSLSDELGKTDFNYPEIGITYGEATYKLSLTLNKTGFEIADADKDPNSYKDISTRINDVDYHTKVFIRKEFNDGTSMPTLCLYETVTDTTGTDQNIRLECVNREFPEIDGTISAGSTRKVLISSPANTVNTYDTASIDLAYQGTIGSPSVTTTSATINIANAVQRIAECSDDVEKYEVCAQRDPCNSLTNECVNNEIAIQNAAHGADLSDNYALRNYCQNTLTPLCNAKKDDLSGGVTDHAYGWYNEICITSGFNGKLRNVLSYKINGGSVKGKCLAVDSLTGNVCEDGGKPLEIGETGQDCRCLEYVEGVSYSAEDYVVRKETPREAGLCLDLPVPEMCYAIDYDNDTDVSGCAGDVTCIENTINAARTAGSATGNADFLTDAFNGMIAVEGQCKGNWTYVKDVATGLPLSPKMNCDAIGSAAADWDRYSLINPCVRYSCRAINTRPVATVSGSAAIISYTGNYTIASEDATTQGQSNGYATWSSKTSSDVNETATANACITGFEATGGNLPTRQCTPKGVWQNVSNSCTRIVCPAVNTVRADGSYAAYGSSTWNGAWDSSAINPSNSALTASQRDEAWLGWHTYSGATFPSAKASRIYMGADSDAVAVDSIATGTCNEALGYFQAPGGSQPTMKCNSLGQWVALDNQCVTTCDEVNATTSTDFNNGHAFWKKANIDHSQDSVAGEFDGCRDDSTTGFKYTPYAYGLLTDATVRKTQTEPARLCVNHNVELGNTGTYIKAAYWDVASPACVNKCPGVETDPRVGVGKTEHVLRNGTVVTLSWNDANPGEEQIIFGPNTSYGASQADNAPDSVSDYHQGNASYAVKRVCDGLDANGNVTTVADNMVSYQWRTYNGGTETVKPLCSSYAGTSGTSNENIANTNALFGTNSRSYAEELSAITATACISNYGIPSGDSQPQYTCQQTDSNRYINEFYYAKSGGDVCKIGCLIPDSAQTTNAELGSTGSYYSGSSTIKYEGENITLSCIDNYGKAADANSSTSDNSCGIANTARGNVSPTATCDSNGQWIITNDCTACTQCRCSAGSCSSNPFIGSTSDTRLGVYCTYANDGGSNGDDVYTSGTYNKSDVEKLCGNDDDSTYNLYPGTVQSGSYQDVYRTGSDSNSVTWRFRCYDGLFTVEQIATTGNSGDIKFQFK